MTEQSELNYVVHGRCGAHHPPQLVKRIEHFLIFGTMGTLTTVVHPLTSLFQLLKSAVRKGKQSHCKHVKKKKDLRLPASSTAKPNFEFQKK